MSEGTRYFRWRGAIVRPIWQLDRHWYVMLGQMFLNSPNHPAVEWTERQWWRADGRDVSALPPFWYGHGYAGG